jgi:hypothetical protein
MAEGPIVVSTTKTWRKVSTGIKKGINVSVPELKEVDNLRKEDTPYSFRENIMILDLNEDGGVATIGEGEFEAEEGSIDLEEGALTLSHFNARFNISNLAKYAERAGGEAQLERDLKWRGMKKVEAMAAHVGDYFWGSATGVLALCDLNVTTQTTLTLTLYAGYGNTGITDPAFLVRKFKPQINGKGGDVVALVNGSSLVANSFARVTAVNTSTGALTVAVISGSVTVNATGLKVVKANSKGRLTISHTDFNRGLPGVQDILYGATYHSLNHPQFTPAYTSSTTGRFTFADFLRADDEIDLNGRSGAKGEVVYIDMAVKRDAIAYERAGVRWASADNMSMDGSLKSDGRRFVATKRVPPGWVVMRAKDALYKWELHDTSDSAPNWGDGKEYIDLSGQVFRIERVLGLVVPNRKLWVGFTNKQRA